MVGERVIEPKVIRYKTKEELIEDLLKQGYEKISRRRRFVSWGINLRKRLPTKRRMKSRGKYAYARVYTTTSDRLTVVFNFPLIKAGLLDPTWPVRHDCWIRYEVTEEGLVSDTISPFDTYA